MDDSIMHANERFQALLGEWAGEMRTFLQPGEAAQVAQVRGRMRPLPGSQFVIHEYASSFDGKPFEGLALLAYNGFDNQYEMAWVDSFHMATNIMWCKGDETAAGFTVRGTYQFDAAQPAWGWRTQFTLEGADHLTITSYNVTPAGDEHPAVEISYWRAAA